MTTGNGKSLLDQLRQWPVARQISDLVASTRPLTETIAELGMGDEAISEETRRRAPRTRDATNVTESVCPYCAVGCGTLIYSQDNYVIDVEGNPDSPINEGTLCPKGSAIAQLALNPDRATKVLYRAPYATEWEEKPLDWAMDRIAERFKETRDAGFVHKREEDDLTINQSTNIGVLGGATLDDEENYLIKKFFTGGLGVVWLENQARI